MTENEARTVTIPIDEYFDLRTKAEINAMLIERLGQLEGKMWDIDRRIYELEQRLKCGVQE